MGSVAVRGRIVRSLHSKTVQRGARNEFGVRVRSTGGNTVGVRVWGTEEGLVSGSEQCAIFFWVDNSNEIYLPFVFLQINPHNSSRAPTGLRLHSTPNLAGLDARD